VEEGGKERSEILINVLAIKEKKKKKEKKKTYGGNRQSLRPFGGRDNSRPNIICAIAWRNKILVQGHRPGLMLKTQL